MFVNDPVIITATALRLAERQSTNAEELLQAINDRLALMPGESVVDGLVKHGDSFIVLYTFSYRSGATSNAAATEKRCASFYYSSVRGVYDMRFNMIVE